MNVQNKPAFQTWDRSNLDKIVDELWDDNLKLRDANEQLRNDLKDAMRLLRESHNTDDWK